MNIEACIKERLCWDKIEEVKIKKFTSKHRPDNFPSLPIITPNLTPRFQNGELMIDRTSTFVTTLSELRQRNKIVVSKTLKVYLKTEKFQNLRFRKDVIQRNNKMVLKQQKFPIHRIRIFFHNMRKSFHERISFYIFLIPTIESFQDFTNFKFFYERIFFYNTVKNC